MTNFSMLDEITTAVLEPPPRTVTVPEPAPLRATDTDKAPAWIQRGHIPGLDGLRAVAVLMVLVAHMYQTVGFPDWPHFKLPPSRQRRRHLFRDQRFFNHDITRA